MKKTMFCALAAVTLIAPIITGFARAANETAQAAPQPAQPPPAIPPADAGPQVPPAAPGVFTLVKKGANRLHLTVSGHSFTSRDAVEKYLAYRAATAATSQHASWFVFVQNRAKGDTIAAPKRDPQGSRYSFRMASFQPVWRYKTASTPKWEKWSPFSTTPFFADKIEAKAITAYEASVDIELHKGQMEDDNPLAFDAGALSDFLVNQVAPPT
ncbi:MAG TPA: hypothetical protein VGH23_14655 [Rhizomicrobium sp.]|jgi:hypothetical protein